MGQVANDKDFLATIKTEWANFHAAVTQLHTSRTVTTLVEDLKNVKTRFHANEKNLSAKIEGFQAQIASKEAKSTLPWRRTGKVKRQAIGFDDLLENLSSAVTNLEKSIHLQEMRVHIERDGGLSVEDSYKLLTRFLELAHLMEIGSLTLDYMHLKKEWATPNESRERMMHVNMKCIEVVAKHLSDIQKLTIFLNNTMEKAGRSKYALMIPLNGVVQSIQFELNNLRQKYYAVQSELGHLSSVMPPPKGRELTESLYNFEQILRRNQQDQQQSQPRNIFVNWYRACAGNRAFEGEVQRIKTNFGFLIQSQYTHNEVLAHVIHEYRHAQDPVIKRTLGDILWLNHIEPVLITDDMLRAYQALYDDKQAEKQVSNIKTALV